MNHPVSARITRPSEKSQRAFAAAACRFVDTLERVSVAITDEGLIVRGLTDNDVEQALREVEKHFSGVNCGKPQVEYQAGPPLLEPFYRIIADVPEECWKYVMEDLSNRRALCQAMRDSATGKRVVSSVPVSEFFGYATVFRSLTRGRGSYFVEFSHYGPCADADA